MRIRAIIMDGIHGGQEEDMTYSPVIRKPILPPVSVIFDRNHDLEGILFKDVQYRECFRSVDKKTVLYSMEGDSKIISSLMFHRTK